MLNGQLPAGNELVAANAEGLAWYIPRADYGRILAVERVVSWVAWSCVATVAVACNYFGAWFATVVNAATCAATA